MKMQESKRLLTIAEVSYRLGISPTQLYSVPFCDRVGLERVRLGRAVRFTSDSVNALIERKFAPAKRREE